MNTLHVTIDRKTTEYDIVIGQGVLSSVSEHIKQHHPEKKVVLITDTSLHTRFENTIKKNLTSVLSTTLTVEPGEQSKSREVKRHLEDQLLEAGCGKDTVLIALGGGVIGDLVGYAASTYMRGIPLIHIPTTLLAMIDSSIGGKTGVNTKHGKNLIGSVWQPDSIWCDLDFLTSLPDEEIACGMAEIIKIAASREKEFFDFLQDNNDAILKRDPQLLETVIARSAQLKAAVVQQDETEKQLRQVLNVGHTVGHAIEQCKNYELKHGHCVSIGMAVETKIAVDKGLLSKSDREKILKLLTIYQLPITVPTDCTYDSLLNIMKIDKKSKQSEPQFVLLTAIGQVHTDNDCCSFPVDNELITGALAHCQE